MALKTEERTTTTEADAMYQRYVKPNLNTEDKNKFVEIDLDSGDFEIGKDDIEIHDKLQARRPNGRFILMGADGGDAGAFGFAHYDQVTQ